MHLRTKLRLSLCSYLQCYLVRVFPHSHDLDENMRVGYGELEQFYWSNGPGIPMNRTVRAGSRVHVEASVTHAIFAGHTGVIFHQPIHSEETWRKTWFAPTFYHLYR